MKISMVLWGRGAQCMYAWSDLVGVGHGEGGKEKGDLVFFLGRVVRAED